MRARWTRRLFTITALGAIALITPMACGAEDFEETSGSFQAGTGSGSGLGGALLGVGETLWDDLWHAFCDQLDLYTEAGIRTFCDAYLDRKGYAKSGWKRTAARSVCVSKVRGYINWKWLCEGAGSGSGSGSGSGQQP